MCSDLSVLGCVKAKSLILKYPMINENLERHFIRGYFDGDGHIGYHAKKKHLKTVVFYSGSNLFMKHLEKRLNYFGFPCKLKVNNRIAICQQKLIKKMFNFLYDNSHVYLNRKYLRFIS